MKNNDGPAVAKCQELLDRIWQDSQEFQKLWNTIGNDSTKAGIGLVVAVLRREGQNAGIESIGCVDDRAYDEISNYLRYRYLKSRYEDEGSPVKVTADKEF